MLHVPTMTDIEARAKRLGLSIGDLALKAGIARSTPYRWLKGNPWTSRSMEQFVRALREAEDGVIEAIAKERQPGDVSQNEARP